MKKQKLNLFKLLVVASTLGTAALLVGAPAWGQAFGDPCFPEADDVNNMILDTFPLDAAALCFDASSASPGVDTTVNVGIVVDGTRINLADQFNFAIVTNEGGNQFGPEVNEGFFEDNPGADPNFVPLNLDTPGTDAVIGFTIAAPESGGPQELEVFQAVSSMCDCATVLAAFDDDAPPAPDPEPDNTPFPPPAPGTPVAALLGLSVLSAGLIKLGISRIKESRQ